MVDDSSDPADGSVSASESATMPLVPLRSAFWRQDEFYADAAVAMDAQAMPMRLAVMLTPLDRALPRHVLGGGGIGSWTFFAGAPSRPVDSGLDWPRRTGSQDSEPGAPLTHVLQVDLYGVGWDQGEESMEDTGLPATGLLQFFHDCETYGDEASDGDAWSVRWVSRDAEASSEAEQGAWEPTPRPADMDPEAFGEPIPLAHEVAPSIPNLSGLRVLPAPDKKRYTQVYRWIEEHPYYQNVARRPEHSRLETPWSDEHEPPPAASRLMGFSAVPPNDDYDRLVRQYLPLEPGDEHVLLADINPLQFDEANDDWFHGGRHVEFWIRHTDLAERRFDRAWALIRTDH